MPRSQVWADEVAQWVKLLAAKPDNLSSIPWNHTAEGKDQFPEVSFWLNVYSMVLTSHTPDEQTNKYLNKILK